jgi:hypothetical protein
MIPSPLRWPLLALMGLLIAAAIAILATQMVSQKIGISSEPLSAGMALAPRSTAPKKPPATRTTTSSPGTTTTSAPAPVPAPLPMPATPSAPSDGGGEGGDD